MGKETMRHIRVGLVGAGLGGLAAAIAIARAGAKVTVLEAAEELAEIGAGIQMTPNVSRFLIKSGVSDIIGDNLVEVADIKMRREDGRIVQRTELVPKTKRELGFPWWGVHRHHLHTGLAEGARRHGVELVVDARVTKIEYQQNPVKVTTAKQGIYEFDLVIGSDGLKSVVRSTLFPDVKPTPPANHAAYRAIIPYKDLFDKVPEARQLLGNTFDVWSGKDGYVIGYPISAGKDFNMVLCHVRDKPTYDVEEVDMQELRDFYGDYDPTLKKIIDMIPQTQRWPLLVTGPLESWTSPQSNVVLMGDAAHSMVNHMAQGAATSMEDGVFLGRVLYEVIRKNLTIPEALHIYERTRMPRVWMKQQASYLMGRIYTLPDGLEQEARDEASKHSVNLPEDDQPTPWQGRTESNAAKVTGPDSNIRGWNLWGQPEAALHIWTYDAEGDADAAVVKYLQEKGGVDGRSKVAKEVERKWTYFMGKDHVDRARL